MTDHVRVKTTTRYTFQVEMILDIDLPEVNLSHGVIHIHHNDTEALNLAAKYLPVATAAMRKQRKDKKVAYDHFDVAYIVSRKGDSMIVEYTSTATKEA